MEEYMQYVDEALALRDNLAAATGYDTVSYTHLALGDAVTRVQNAELQQEAAFIRLKAAQTDYNKALDVYKRQREHRPEGQGEDLRRQG